MRRDNPDRSARDIIANLEREGYLVIRIASAVQRRAGVPDAIVARNRFTHLVELKSPGGHMSPAQVKFAMEWKGRCLHVGSSSWEIGKLLEECEAGR